MARITRMTKKRLGELLVDEGLITQEQVTSALGKQKATGRLLGEILLREGIVSEEDIAKAIVRQFGLPFLSPKKYFISEAVSRLLPERMLRQYQFVPIDKIGNILVIVAAGVLNVDVIAELESLAKCTVQAYVGTVSDVTEAIDKLYSSAQDHLTDLGQMLLRADEAPPGEGGGKKKA